MSICIAGMQIAFQAILRCFHPTDFNRLLRQLLPQIRDRLIATLNIFTSKLTLMRRIAQLRFECRRNLRARRGRRDLYDVGTAPDAGSVSIETKRDKKQNSRGVKHPYVTPGRLTGKWAKSMGIGGI